MHVTMIHDLTILAQAVKTTVHPHIRCAVLLEFRYPSDTGTPIPSLRFSQRISGYQPYCLLKVDTRTQ